MQVAHWCNQMRVIVREPALGTAGSLRWMYIQAACALARVLPALCVATSCPGALQREEAEAQETAAAEEKDRLAREAGALAGTAGALEAPVSAAAAGHHHAVRSVLDSTLEDSESDSDTEASHR